MKRKFLYVSISLLISILSSFVLFSIELPDSFGKTHFIIGVDCKTLKKQVEQSLPKEKSNNVSTFLTETNTGIHCALFSPDDNILAVLLDLIQKEQKGIKMTAFLLTDPKIINALIQAKDRGIEVELIFDQKATQNGYIKIDKLINKDIPVFVYNPMFTKARISNIMHNKFIIFEKNILDKKLVWTGSFNFTYSAQKNNQENVVILDDANLATKFEKQFERLKIRCATYHKQVAKA